MVYGRILYNNIKEYTPKWYPTVPYSQTVKPTFSNFCNYFKEDLLKLFLPLIQAPTSRPDGDFLQRYSNKTHGCGKFSFLDVHLRCITQFIFHLWQSINRTTPIEHTKLQLQRKKLSRKSKNNFKMLKQANDLK